MMRGTCMTELVPAMSVPVICTPNLSHLLAHYRDELGFRVIQEVRGVLAFIQHGPVRLQLWQRAGKLPADCRIQLDGHEASAFQVHAMLARHARGALNEEAPGLRPWGAWEFSLTDAEGNRLLFVQWVVNSVLVPHCR
jgi:hypothetical protein